MALTSRWPTSMNYWREGVPPTNNPPSPLLSSQVASIQGKMFGLLGTSVRACDLAVLSRREAGKRALKL